MQRRKHPMFKDSKTLNPIHADLDSSVSHGTLRPQDLLWTFLDILKDTPEYAQLTCSNVIPSHAKEDEDAGWWEEEASYIMESLIETLNSYAPEGYYFGTHPGDGSDYGFWKTEEYEEQIGNITQIVHENRSCEGNEIENFIELISSEEKPVTEEDILSAFDNWKKQEDLENEEILDNYWASL